MEIPQWLIDFNEFFTNFWKIAIVKMTFLLIFYAIVLWLLFTLLDKSMTRMRKTYPPELIDGTRGIIKILIISFVFAAYLNQFPEFQGIFIGFAAILGTAIGFASQQSLGNFLAGIYILTTRPFKVNDYVSLPSLSVEGVVMEMRINHTVILQPNQTLALLPNRTLLDARIINMRVQTITEHSTTPNGKKSIVPRFAKSLLNTQKKEIFAYPIVVGVDPNQYNKVESAISKVLDEMKDRLTLDPTWYVVGKTRLETKYEIVLFVDDASKILDLTSEFLSKIEKELSIVIPE